MQNRWAIAAVAVAMAACTAPPPNGRDDAGSEPPPLAACALPEQLDFGALAVGDSSIRTLPLVNSGPDALRVQLEAVTASGGDAAAFSVGLPAGEVAIAPGSTTTLAITFKPTAERSFLAQLRIVGAEGCPAMSVVLFGDGANTLLTWQPRPLQFGYVPPGFGVEGELTFLNLSANAVELKNLAPNGPHFTPDGASVLVPAATVNEARIRTPGTAKLTVFFTPKARGVLSGTVSFTTGLPKQPAGSALCTGVGGGPDIEVTPAPILDFGKVAFQQGANLYTLRKLVVRNAGTRPSPGADVWNLHLGTPRWQVTTLSGNASVDELCVGSWDDATSSCLGTLPAYDDVKGLPAEDSNAKLEIPVRLQPKSIGLKTWKVRIFSNDLDEPAVDINVTAEVKLYPPCNFSVTPLALNFGLTAPPDDRTLDFLIRNHGTASGDLCLIGGLDLAAGSNAMFSLPSGPIGSRELGPSETLRIPVRARPSGATPTPFGASGAVEFSINNPAVQRRSVSLSGSIGESCLVIAPRTLDFGTVQSGCSSATRVFSIYNRCATGVIVTGAQMTQGAEFSAVDLAGVAPSTVIAPNAAAVTLSLKYRPVDLGPDSGAFTLNLFQNGEDVDEVIVLRGNGGTTGANSDTFSTDARKADVLMIIDDSCSMSDKQSRLQASWTPFFQYATNEKVDWQLGVTTTDMLDAARKGRIIGNMANPKVLTSSTPNVLSLFQSKVLVGINGSASPAPAMVALSALTSPVIDNENAGLVRADARLGVVVITDDGDESLQPFSYYVNTLLNVKGAQRPELFSYSAIAPTLAQAPQSGCTYGSSTSGRDPFHQNMVLGLGGVIRELCTNDWPKTIEEVGARAFHTLGNGFNLRAVPDTSQPMTLRLDGALVPQTDVNGVTLWTYDALTNTINFTPVSQPGPGKTIQVDYQVACLP